MRMIHGEYGWMDEADVERFWKVGAPTVVQVGHRRCWVWNGKREWQGYGRFWLNGQWRPAHRVAWLYLNPRTLKLRRSVLDIPEELPALDHECNNRPCLRRAHLNPVTMRTNHRLRAQRYWARKLSRRETTVRMLHPLFGEELL